MEEISRFNVKINNMNRKSKKPNLITMALLLPALVLGAWNWLSPAQERSKALEIKRTANPPRID